MLGRLLTCTPTLANPASTIAALPATALTIALLAVATGCSTTDEVSGQEPVATVAAESTTTAPAEVDEVSSDSAPPPARRVPTQVSSESTHWVGHGFMTDDKIEIVWSQVEGDDVVYQIFRFDGIGFDPAEVELIDPVHEGIGTLRWDDESVDTGSFYTYILRVIADDEVLERRWTATLAVTDTTPPRPVTDLSATITDEGILLDWSPSEDDVEFGSYSVLRTDLGDEPQYIGGGGDQEVTSFIDDDLPGAGDVGYEVLATDFHGNQSEPATITISLD